MDPDRLQDTVRVPHGGDPDPDVLDFSANVNPRTPPGTERAYRDALERSRRYPDDGYPAFRSAAGAYVGCERDRIVPTPGGLAAIRLLLETTLEPGDRALVPFPSFGEYAREVRLQGATPEFVPHDEVTDVDDGRLADAALAIVCTPNNPTGDVTDPNRLERFARRCSRLETRLLVDEAFLGFTGERSAATFDAEPVAIARSLTKLFGLPGLRAGFAVASGSWLDELRIARRAWSLGTPATRVGTHCMNATDFVAETRIRTARERSWLVGQLGRCEVSPVSSRAPFVLCSVQGRPVDEVIERTREGGVSIRDARTFRGLDSHVRVAVKGREANERLVEVLSDD